MPRRRIEKLVDRPRRCKALLNGVREAPIISCIACELRASIAVATDTPIAAPRLRSRLNSDAPSVRNEGSSVANASIWIGVKQQPHRAALNTIVTMISRSDNVGSPRRHQPYE